MVSTFSLHEHDMKIISEFEKVLITTLLMG